MEKAIEIKNVSKSFMLPHEKNNSLKERFLHPFSKIEFEKINVLKNVSCDIHQGEWVGVIGKNGCGKSTLLKIIAGVYTQDSGEVSVHGKLVPFLELGVGFNPELTARENICLNGVILGMRRAKVVSRIPAIANYAGITKFLDQRLKNFSSGMQVRLAFAVAMQVTGDVYLLDEILAVGDAEFQAKSALEFERLKSRGVTAIFVSHSTDSILKHCDRVLWIENGLLRMFGPANEVIAAFVANGY
ncbi:MAG: ABC transporter ATP-binding protein [bacterium]